MATIKDVVLIYLEDSPVSFARVESILPDHKKNWYQIKLLMLQIPLQVVTWILKDDYINGEEFHMNGKKMKFKTVECPGEELVLSHPKKSSRDLTEISEQQGKPEEPTAKIISFPNLKKKDHGPDPA